MMAVICFDLIPDALEISNISDTIIGIIAGIITMIYFDLLVQKRFNLKLSGKNKTNNLLKTGIIISIGIAIHNIPEGLAIGSGFEASMKLGLGLAIAICIHDIPERKSKVDTIILYFNRLQNKLYLNCANGFII